MRTFIKVPTNTLGVVILLIVICVAVFADRIAPYDPVELRAQIRLQPPTREHVFGTDQNGRDVFSRVVFGSRISLLLGLVIVVTSSVLGISVGIVAMNAGILGEEVIMRLADATLSIPPLLLGMIIASALGPSAINTALAVALTRWPDYTRLVRSLLLTERRKAYVEAAYGLGVSHVRLLLFHIGPNIMAPIIIKLTLDMGYGILMLASLSFIGLGTQPPTPEWGSMVSSGRGFILDCPWIALFPGLGIFLTVLGFSLFGDGIRDFTDPHMQKKTHHKTMEA